MFIMFLSLRFAAVLTVILLISLAATGTASAGSTTIVGAYSCSKNRFVVNLINGNSRVYSLTTGVFAQGERPLLSKRRVRKTKTGQQQFNITWSGAINPALTPGNTVRVIVEEIIKLPRGYWMNDSSVADVVVQRGNC